MAVYSLENATASKRTSGQVIVPDSSYVIALTDATETYHPAVKAFHECALKNNAEFFINVTVRHELLSHLRYGHLIKACLDLHASDASVEVQYRSVSRRDGGLGVTQFVGRHAEKILKCFIKAGDSHRISSLMTSNCVPLLKAHELANRLIYMSGSAGEASWDHLGHTMLNANLAPTDGMIVNFGKYIGAHAVASLDLGFVLAHQDINIYVPMDRANEAVGIYDLAKDT